MRTLLTLGLVFGLSALSAADDKKKGDPTGTWKWETEFNGQKRTSTLKLKAEGDKLTGAMVGRNDTETKIDDATMKDGEISFSVTREFNGNKMTTKYKGKVDGDTLKMTAESERNGEKVKREIEAKREKTDK